MRALTTTSIVLLVATVALPDAVADHPTSKDFIGPEAVTFESSVIHDEAVVCVEGDAGVFDSTPFSLKLSLAGTVQYSDTFHGGCLALIGVAWDQATVQPALASVDTDTLEIGNGEPMGTIHLFG